VKVYMCVCIVDIRRWECKGVYVCLFMRVYFVFIHACGYVCFIHACVFCVHLCVCIFVVIHACVYLCSFMREEVGPQIRYIEYKTIHYQKATCISVFCMYYSLKSWQIQLF
jgi:hypothetical protein